MERPCSQELPAVQPSCLESGGPREPDLHCRARQPSSQPCPAQALCRASIAQCQLGTCHVTSLAVDIPGTGFRDHPLPPPRWAVKQGLQLFPQPPRSSLIPPGQKLQGAPLALHLPHLSPKTFCFCLSAPALHAVGGLILPSSIYWYCSLARSCLTLFDSMHCNIPGFPVLHYLPEFV